MVSGSTEWLPAPTALALHERDVHVWRIALKQEYPRVSLYESVLSFDEKDKARRYRFEHSRNEYIITRGILRSLIAGYLDTNSEQLQFTYNPYGKPALGLGWMDTKLAFNVSHANDYALIALTKGREIGIDIEHIKPSAINDKVAESFFSSEEVTALKALPDDKKPLGFFNCWTRKEAYIKARGEGLTIPLNQFDVSLDPGEPAALLNCRIDPTDVSKWTLLSLLPGYQHVGALAVEGNGLTFTCFDWKPPVSLLQQDQSPVYQHIDKNSEKNSAPEPK